MLVGVCTATGSLRWSGDSIVPGKILSFANELPVVDNGEKDISSPLNIASPCPCPSTIPFTIMLVP